MANEDNDDWAVSKPIACEGCSFYVHKGDGDFVHNCSNTIANDMGTACWAIVAAGGDTCEHKSSASPPVGLSVELNVDLGDKPKQKNCNTCKFRGKVTLGSMAKFVCTAPSVTGDESFVHIHSVREQYVEEGIMRSRCAHHLHHDAPPVLPILKHVPQVLCKDCKHIEPMQDDMPMSVCAMGARRPAETSGVVTGKQERHHNGTTRCCFILNEFGDCEHFEHVDAETETPAPAVKKKRVVMLCSQKTQ